MSNFEIIIELIGWVSTLTFLLSIVMPERSKLHEWGMFTSVTTGIYAFYHGATAIWVKWIIAFLFNLYMWLKLKKSQANKPVVTVS